MRRSFFRKTRSQRGAGQHQARNEQRTKDLRKQIEPARPIQLNRSGQGTTRTGWKWGVAWDGGFASTKSGGRTRRWGTRVRLWYARPRPCIEAREADNDHKEPRRAHGARRDRHEDEDISGGFLNPDLIINRPEMGPMNGDHFRLRLMDDSVGDSVQTMRLRRKLLRKN